MPHFLAFCSESRLLHAEPPSSQFLRTPNPALSRPASRLASALALPFRISRDGATRLRLQKFFVAHHSAYNRHVVSCSLNALPHGPALHLSVKLHALPPPNTHHLLAHRRTHQNPRNQREPRRSPASVRPIQSLLLDNIPAQARHRSQRDRDRSRFCCGLHTRRPSLWLARRHHRRCGRVRRRPR